MDIKEQIRNKYYTPTESVNIVYDIFKDFFNEVRVDLQINKEFKNYLEYLLEARDEDSLNEIFNYDLNGTLNTVKFKRIYTEISPFFIFVHFPDVTITNEHNDSTVTYLDNSTQNNLQLSSVKLDVNTLQVSTKGPVPKQGVSNIGLFPYK